MKQYSRDDLCDRKFKIQSNFPFGKGLYSPKRKISEAKEQVLTQITIQITKGDELEPNFFHLFSKNINCGQFKDIEHLIDSKQIKYQDFYKVLVNKSFPSLDHSREDYSMEEQKVNKQQEKRFVDPSLILNQRKSSFEDFNYEFSFESEFNNIIFLLDLSPYMLFYDYSIRTFPLKNIAPIVRTLISGIKQHHFFRVKNELESSYRVVFYAFSTCQNKIEKILTQQITFQDELDDSHLENLVTYIGRYISKSKLPHVKVKKQTTIGSIIQQVLNIQQGRTGIQTLVTISNFYYNDLNSRIFFTSNWYTFAFICTGQLNFGSYNIDEEKIRQVFRNNSSFKTKYIFTVKKIEKGQSSKQEKIVFCEENMEDVQVFPKILKILLKPSKREKDIGSQRINQYDEEVAEDSLMSTLKNKYLQGWEQIPTDQFIHMTKYLFKFHFWNGPTLTFKAQRKSNIFTLKMFVNKIGHQSLTFKKLQRIIEKLKFIDSVNTSNFDLQQIEKHLQSNAKNTKKEKFRNFYSHSQRGDQIQTQIQVIRKVFNSHREWSNFFKVRKVYIKFNPQFSKQLYEQFLIEIDYFFNGKKFSNYEFVSQKERKIKCEDKIANNKQAVEKRVVFTYLTRIFNFLQIKFGFLRYQEKEIEEAIQSIISKFECKKLKYGIISIVPEDIYKFCQTFQLNTIPPFREKWGIKLLKNRLYQEFRAYFSSVLEKIWFIYLRQKNYYKIIFVKRENKEFKKVIFLKIKDKPLQSSIEFQMFTKPAFHAIDPFEKEVKPISEIILFQKIVQSVKQYQKKILVIIENYGWIYEVLLLIHFHGMKERREFRSFLPYNEGEQSMTLDQCQECLKKYYPESVNKNEKQAIASLTKAIKIETLPFPTKKLAKSFHLKYIKGDFSIQSNDLSFTFFLFKPELPIYVTVKEEKVYYKIIRLPEREENNNEEQEQKIRLGLIRNIEIQQKCENYSSFFQSIKLGSLLQQKNIFNQHTTCILQLQKIIQTVKLPVNELKRQSGIDRFISIFFDIIKHFFQESQQDNFYFQKHPQDFQKKKSQNYDQYEKILGKHKLKFQQILLKFFLHDEQGEKPLKEEIFREALIRVTDKKWVIKVKAFGRKFEEDECKFIFIKNQLQKLIQQCSVYLQIISLTQSTDFFPFLKMLQHKNMLKEIHPTLAQPLINENQTIKKLIQLQTMKKYINFQKLPNNLETSNDKYISYQQQKVKEEKITIKTNHLFQLQIGKNVFIMKRANFIYMEKSSLEMEKLYCQKLLDLVKIDKLMNFVSQRQQFPEVQIDIDDEVLNNSFSRNSKQMKGKKGKKYVPLKYRKKDAPLRSDMSDEADAEAFYLGHIPEAFQHRINPKYQRLKFVAGKCLNAISKFVKFSQHKIKKAKNKYILTVPADQKVILYFEEVSINSELPELDPPSNESKNPIALVYHVHCLNEYINRAEVQAYVNKMIEEALREDTFSLISQIIGKNPHLIEDAEFEELKPENETLSIKVPWISEKSNFRQYLKQHIEIYHNRTEIAQLKKIIEQKGSQYNQENRCVINEDRRCIPSMWIFNSQAHDSLASKFGKCIYLLKISIESEWSTVENSHFWNRSSTQQYIYPHNDNQEQMRKLQNRLQFYKKGDEEQKNQGRSTITFHITHSIGSPQVEEIKNTLKLMVKFALYDYFFEVSIFSLLIEQILPIIFPEIDHDKQSNKYMKRRSLDDKINHEKMLNANMDNFDLLSPTKSPINEYDYKKQLKLAYSKFFKWTKHMQQLVSIQNQGLSISTYKTSAKLSIHYLDTYAFDFLENIVQSFKAQKTLFCLPILIHARTVTGEDLYWSIEYKSKEEEELFNRFKQIQKEISNLPNDMKKVQILSFDLLVQILHLQKRFKNFGKRTSNLTQQYWQDKHFEEFKADFHNKRLWNFLSENIELPEIKQYHEGHSFCQNDFLFKRSVLFHYEISEEGFSFFTYNYKYQLLLEQREYLMNIQRWIREKNRLQKFIEKTRLNQQSQKTQYNIIPHIPLVQQKSSFLQSLSKVKREQMKRKQNISKSDILKTLVFSVLPAFSIQSRQVQKLDQIYSSLSSNPVNYRQYPEYKGKQKTSLERIGRQYLSILRYSFGMSSRKASAMNND